MKLNDDGVNRLIFAVFKQAVADYASLISNGKMGSTQDPNLNRVNIEQFFRDDPYCVLEDRNITGDDLINAIKNKYTRKKKKGKRLTIN